jgi:hypothetical protein
MTDLLMPVLTCPFCPPGRSVVSVDLRVVRAAVGREVRLDPAGPNDPAVGREVRLDPAGPNDPAVSFQSGGAGPPCPQLIHLELWALWERLSRRDDAPVGSILVHWAHPATATVAAERFKRLREAVLPNPAYRRFLPATPVHVETADPKGVVEGRIPTRTWRWRVEAAAVYAADAVRFCDELAAALARWPTTGSAARAMRYTG